MLTKAELGTASANSPTHKLAYEIVFADMSEAVAIIDPDCPADAPLLWIIQAPRGRNGVPEADPACWTDCEACRRKLSVSDLYKRD